MNYIISDLSFMLHILNKMFQKKKNKIVFKYYPNMCTE